MTAVTNDTPSHLACNVDNSYPHALSGRQVSKYEMCYVRVNYLFVGMLYSRGFASPILILIFVVGVVLFGGWWLVNPVNQRAPEPESGIMGMVSRYGCPAQMEGDEDPCGSPYQGTVTFSDAVEEYSVSTETDADGRFSIKARPGTYTAHMEGIGVCKDPIVVEAGMVASTTVMCDNGIR